MTIYLIIYESPIGPKVYPMPYQTSKQATATATWLKRDAKILETWAGAWLKAWDNSELALQVHAVAQQRGLVGYTTELGIA